VVALEAAGVDDEGAKELAAALRTSRWVAEVRLPYNSVGDEGGEALARSLAAPVAVLDLSNNDGGDGAARWPAL
jgi:hypothetical protein